MKSALDISRKSPSGRGEGGGGSVGVGEGVGPDGLADGTSELEVGLGTTAMDGLGVASSGAGRSCIRLAPMIAPVTTTSAASHTGRRRRGRRGGRSAGGPPGATGPSAAAGGDVGG